MKRLLALIAMTVLSGVAILGGTGCESKKWDDPELDSLADVYHDIRDSSNEFVTLRTTYGDLTFELYHDVAPTHADSFAARTADGFYDSMLIHRSVKDFMFQSGNPMTCGKSIPSYTLDAEFSDLPHQAGTLSMARAMDPNSASTQFFVCYARSRSTQWLDGKYTVFGQLIKGFDVLKRLERVPVKASQWMNGEESEPVENTWIVDAYLSDPAGHALE